jgi:hypothetical protein
VPFPGNTAVREERFERGVRDDRVPLRLRQLTFSFNG